MNGRKQPVRYNYTFLQEFCKEYNLVLLKDYGNEKLHRDFKIEGNCKTERCSNIFVKTIGVLLKNKNFGCISCSKQIANERKETNNINKYGVKSPLQLKSVKSQIKETNKAKYGVEYPQQSKTIQKTTKLNNLKKYGVEYPLQLESVKSQIKETNLEKYGCEYATQSQVVRDKTVSTCIEKYGVKTSLQLEIIKSQIKETNIEKYGCEYATQSQEVREKTVSTCIEKYGTECPLQNSVVKIKSIETNKEKYGVCYANQNNIIKEKIRNTNIDKYGVNCVLKNEIIKSQIKETNLERYGCEYATQSQEVREKIKNTCLEKYGVEYPQQNSEISEKTSKNAYKLKSYTFPSGNIIQVQGYEPFGLDELIHTEQINESDVVTKRTEVPTIWYEDSNGKKHRYFVDMFIPSQKRCIEIKSTWTMEKKRDSVFEKQQAMKNAGYECEIWVYNEKGKKVECYK